MPEGPEVQRVRMSLESKIIGKTVVKAEILLDKIIKQQNPNTFLERIVGLTIEAADRRGKYLLFPMEKANESERVMDALVEGGDGRYKMIIHLGMTGAVFAVKHLDEIMPEFKKHVHVILTLDDGTLMTYCDIRRFGGLRVFTNEEFANYGSIKDMGPEWTWDEAEEEFLKRVKKKTHKNKKQLDGSKLKEPIPIKEAILNQNNIAGIGNIYACESLAYSGILPNKPVSDLNDKQLRTIFRMARDVMNFSVSVGGSSISDYVDGEGQRGRMQEYLISYGQKICGLCKDTEIVKTEVAGRGTFHCPKCQK